MENATKALLIAAGVLIVILIIGLGMSIFTSTGDTTGQVQDVSSSQEMQTFNAQFTAYLGSNKSGAMVRNLGVAVNNSNARNTQHQVTYETPATGVVDNARYTVTATYNDATGYITGIKVQ